MKKYLIIALAATAFLQEPPRSEAQMFIGRTPLENSQTLPWSRVPAPVRQTLQSYSGNSSLAGVQVGTINGNIVYRAAMTLNGRPYEMLVGVDGSFYQPVNSLEYNQPAFAVRRGYYSMDNYRAAGETQNGMPMNYGAVPESYNQPTVSETEAAQGGNSMENSQVSPAAGSVITESAGAARQFVTQSVPDTSGAVRVEQIPFGHLPVLVQRTAAGMLGDTQPSSIEATAVNGVLCYAISYSANGGDAATVWIASDGQVMQSSRASQ